MMSVTFYHVAFWLTRVDSSERFSMRHYGLPVMIPVRSSGMEPFRAFGRAGDDRSRG